mmetsp:Transcript_18566/g.21364  ORF Transcript_18566/g.21364 Transcript_18566/m.21364 type:complete len:309 (-) Transcript_18566:284-1210(-)
MALSQHRISKLFLTLLLVGRECCSSIAFSRVDSIVPFSTSSLVLESRLFSRKPSNTLSTAQITAIRGGASKGNVGNTIESNDVLDQEKLVLPSMSKSATILPVMLSAASKAGAIYSAALISRPILTKSVTAGFIFGLSDYVAQKLERSNSGNNKNGEAIASDDSASEKRKVNLTRITSATLVGLLYFGTAAHYWYETIFRLLPNSSLWSTLQKATLGQMIFGPSFTAIFFASALLQSKDFTMRNWLNKIVTDLPQAWMAGLGFWPLVDLVSFSVVPPIYIPLFVNLCSFIWTIYLSLVANNKKEPLSS